jgi:xanthine dehydrogenase accessory factor
MKTIYIEAQTNLLTRTPFAVATVIETWGSAPRKAGAHMLISEGKIIGSVSGGCVENDMYQKALDVIATGESAMVSYGVSDEDAWNVGLSCGGKLLVFIEAFSPESKSDQVFWKQIQQSIDSDTGCVVAWELRDIAEFRDVLLPLSWEHPGLGELAEQAFYRRAHQLTDLDGKLYFLEVVAPRHKLLIFGAAHIASELVKLAKPFGFEVIVIDPREFFTENHLFTEAPDRLEVAWPAEVLNDIPLTPFTYAVILSHDPKIDDQALEILLKSQVAYIGALGSRKTHAKRLERLRIAGFDDVMLERIKSPVGVDIKAQSAQEIALSIVAELIQEKNRFI